MQTVCKLLQLSAQMFAQQHSLHNVCGCRIIPSQTHTHHIDIWPTLPEQAYTTSKAQQAQHRRTLACLLPCVHTCPMPCVPWTCRRYSGSREHKHHYQAPEHDHYHQHYSQKEEYHHDHYDHHSYDDRQYYGKGPRVELDLPDCSGAAAVVGNVRTAGFAAWNDKKAALQAQGVKITGLGATVAQDLEPEYTTFSQDERIAFVSLQVGARAMPGNAWPITAATSGGLRLPGWWAGAGTMPLPSWFFFTQC